VANSPVTSVKITLAAFLRCIQRALHLVLTADSVCRYPDLYTLDIKVVKVHMDVGRRQHLYMCVVDHTHIHILTHTSASKDGQSSLAKSQARRFVSGVLVMHKRGSVRVFHPSGKQRVYFWRVDFLYNILKPSF
jgi:hypothetical protein